MQRTSRSSRKLRFHSSASPTNGSWTWTSLFELHGARRVMLVRFILVAFPRPGLNGCVKAVQLIAHGAPGQFKFADLPDPRPARGEVMVQVYACGLNHLDLWVEEGALPIPVQLPRVQGCEIAGRIFALGDGVTGWKEGDRVAIQSNIFCGE